MKPFFSRRDFLKLSALLSLAALHPPAPSSLREKGEKMLRLFGADAPNNRSITFRGAEANSAPNILIFVFDALSARNLPLYGYARNTAPNLSRFAERATVYHAHHAAANFTTPGTASLLTGVYPWTHRAIHFHGSVLDSFAAARNLFAIHPQGGSTFAFTHNILAEILLQQFRAHIDLFKRTRELAVDDPELAGRLFPRDYNVALWAEQLILRGSEAKPSSLFGGLLYRLLRLSQKLKLADAYAAQFPRGLPNVDDVYFVLEDAINWLIAELPAAPKPSLGYFHILPPHEPYYPRQDFIGRFQDSFQPPAKPESPFSLGRSPEGLLASRTQYDENIAYADEEFGRLYDDLLQTGILEQSVVIVTADHGEMFERGIAGHETPALYEPLLHIPLLISVPGQTQRQDVRTRTSSVDLLPSLAQLLGQPAPAWGEGQVLPGIQGAAADPQRSIYAVEAKSSPKVGPLRKATLAVFQGDYKLISYRGYAQNPAPELYNLADDPEELHDLSAAQPAVVSALQKDLEARLRQSKSL